MDVDVADVLLSVVERGEVRINLGDEPTGKGYGASIAYWGLDGFLTRPNPPTVAGNAQVWYVTEGQSRRAIASRDNRFVGPFGALGEGDRVIVSDCDAGLLLDQSANLIKLASTGVEVAVDGAAGTVTLTRGDVSITLAAAALTLSWGPVPVASIVLSATGVAITATTVTVNNVPLTIP